MISYRRRVTFAIDSPRMRAGAFWVCGCSAEDMGGRLSNIRSMAKCRIPWRHVQMYYDAGFSPLECSIRFDFSRIAWFKAQRAGHLKVRDGDQTVVTGRWKNYTYDWSEVQRFYDEGHTLRQCCERFGFTFGSWQKAMLRGEIKARAREFTVEHVLANSKSRLTVKRTLLRAGILQNRCDECGIVEWRGRPIAIQIDHRNGIHDDHRLENLRMLCPNCHSQTETFAARNRRLKNQSRIV